VRWLVFKGTNKRRWKKVTSTEGLKYYLIASVNAVSSQWITATILRIDNHASQRADCCQQYQTRNIDPHCTAAYTTRCRRNLTGPPCSVGRQTANAPGCRPARRQRYRRRQTTDASEQNNTGPLGGLVSMFHTVYTAVQYHYVVVWPHYAPPAWETDGALTAPAYGHGHRKFTFTLLKITPFSAQISENYRYRHSIKILKYLSILEL